MNVYKAIASFCGIGFIKKGGGTIAALIVCVLLYVFKLLFFATNIGLLLFIISSLFIGVFVSKKTEEIWGKDSNKIVIDEVFGMAVAMLFVPISWQTLSVGFILFRFFDILKPLFIKRLEKFNNGWGVMLDDALAGVYSNIVLQLLLATHLIK